MAEVEIHAASPEAVATESAPEPAEPEPVVVETQEILAVASDHKRKHDELEDDEGAAAEKPEVEASTEAPVSVTESEPTVGSEDVNNTSQETLKIAVDPTDDAAINEAKRPRLNGEADESVSDGGQEEQKLEAPPMGNGQVFPTEDIQHPPTEKPEQLAAIASQAGTVPSAEEQPLFELPDCSRKIEVPNTKVGVLIGKAGDTIRFLQFNSGAKIQITRDGEADPSSSTRPVELIGTLEQVNKAEQLIKDVIAEADAGGSPALVARGFGTARSGTEQLEIQVPNEKVGLIIGKGGETIKNLQTKSGARIQLIPQHLPEGDLSKERIVRVTGNKKEIEAATEMIKEVMNQVPRSSSFSSGYNSQTYRPRGPTALPQWGPRAVPPTQQTMGGYDYQQRGTYPSQMTQYPPQSYGGHPQQVPPRGSWEQRPMAHVQTPQGGGGYDYYAQGGQPTDTHSSGHVPSSAAAAPAPVNYNYGQAQVPGYGQPNPYPQPVPGQQSYGHGYEEPKYDSQAPSQQTYGQPPLNAQSGVYNNPQAGYTQQQSYNKPAYGGGPPAQGMLPQSYGQPRTTQQGDGMYHGAVQSSYGSSGPTQQQQQQPYSSQPGGAYAQSYGTTVGNTDGYIQPSVGSYSQQGGQAGPGYAQSGQLAPTYPQNSQPGVYGQYPSSQPSYGEQPVTNNQSYGYPAGPAADTGYGNNVTSSGYGVPPPAGGQVGYGHPPANPTGYDQSMAPQQGYGSVPPTGQVGYPKSLSPQPVYGQYDTSQMYGHH